MSLKLSNRIAKYAAYTLVAAIAFAGGLWLSATQQSAPPEPSAAESLYAMALPDLQGKPQKLEQWRGKVLVVNFWATWCEPCRKEIPLFVQLQSKYAAKNLQFVGISIDQVDKTQEFAQKFSVNYPNLIGTFDAVEVSRVAGNKRRVLPYTIILDRKGQIAATEMGELTLEKLEATLAPLL